MHMLAFLLAGISAVAANLPDPALLQLGSLFIEDSVEVQSSTCSARFPDSRSQWVVAVRDWKNSNVAELEELRGLSQQVEASAKQRATEGQLVAFRAQAAMLPLLALGSTRDSQAEQLCSKYRSGLADSKASAQIFQQARTAATAALASPVK